MIKVQLTEDEMILAHITGIKRQWAHRDPVTGKRFSTHRFNAQDPAFTGDIKGCLVECAVAKYYGVRWNNETWHLKDHADNKSQADVGDRFEVRRSRTMQGELTIRNTDADNKIAVLGCADPVDENFVYLLGAISIKEARERFNPVENTNIYIQIKDLYPVEDFLLVNA